MNDKIFDIKDKLYWNREEEWKGNSTSLKLFNTNDGWYHFNLGISYLGTDWKKPKPLVRLIDYLIKILYKIRGKI